MILADNCKGRGEGWKRRTKDEKTARYVEIRDKAWVRVASIQVHGNVGYA